MHQMSKFKTTNNAKGNLFVKNLPDDMDNKALMDKFSSYGNILSCKVSFNKTTGAPLHYGYVHFSDPAVASKVLEDMNKDVVAEGDIYVCEYEKRVTDAANDWVECYVSDFPASTTKEDLQALFEQYGKVVSVYIGAKRFKPEKLIAFVKFEKHEDAVKAVENLKEHTFPVEGAEPMKMYVNRLQSREERERINQAFLQEQKKKNIEKTKGRFLYVGFGSEQVTEEKLRELFTPYGGIESLSIAKDKITHEVKPFGFVCMDTVDNAHAAVRAMKEKPDNKLKVEFAQTREERAKILKERRKQNNSGVVYPYNYFMPQVPVNMNRNAAARKNQRVPMMQPAMQTMMRPAVQPMMQPMMQPGMYPQYIQPGNQYMQPANAVDERVNILRNTMQSLQPLNPAYIESLSDDERRNVFGERLFTLISAIGDPRTSKITGMMLELSIQDLYLMVSNPEELNNKIIEANEVLDQSQQNGAM